MAALVNHNAGASETHRRLLEAAAQVFARSGLEGATTREIAREAGVNEVTLFRHFQSKDKLLSAVLQRTFSGPEEALQDQAGLAVAAKGKYPARPTDLRAGLRQYIQNYEDLLRRNILLLRTLIGEIHRHREHEAKVLKGIFAPLKVELMATIHAARKRGAVRADVDPLIAADLLGSMVFMDVLRRTASLAPDYPVERYLETALDLFIRGIAAPKRKKVTPQP